MDLRTLISFSLLCSLCVCQNLPCSKDSTVDITDGSKQKNQTIIKNGISFDRDNYFFDGGRIRGCVCNIKRCIRKCCVENEMMVSKTCTHRRNETIDLNFFNGTDPLNDTVLSDFFIIFGRSCPKNHYPIKAESYDYIMMQNDGQLYYSDFDASYTVEQYCIDVFRTGNGSETSALMCEFSDNEQEKMQADINGTGMIISMPFLLLTFLVYLLLPERNLHRRALMSYVFTLLAAYITLVTIQLYSGQFPDTTCHVLGYLIIFFFLVSFFWMNVMCVDMWLAFSGMRTFLSKKTAERKRFIIYCIYAWGMPIVHVLIVFLINHYGSTDTSWNPQIGVKRCFLGEGMPTFYYFYLPMAILIGINITLFVLTTVRIQKIKKETSMLKQTDSRRHTYEDDKQKFNLYLKLMFAMGVNWITELVSWAVDYAFSETPAYVWYITDFTNAMYGVLIFLIFVFKKKIWRSLKKKYYICIGKPHLAHSMTTSSARGTRTSNYSTTDTTAVSTDYRLSDMKNGKIPEESALNRT
ncbi:G-protein coupled receptor Mth2-like isoform X5 [Diabrotica virgifera virgifera]|uniref:G-protein coupled receptor Mth2-like n=1 Tax=Diabrotica virgifera virgifera TaxID=50390 RepID=A0ABM5KWV5_DIAVI|nr:G-protein coupled receptor Mth2-like isoform X5 [Diabrotica virgifera virgifera]